MKTYTLQCKNSSATFIPSRGGMASSIILESTNGSREILYVDDNFSGWPFCFPICGRLNRKNQPKYEHQGQLYRLDGHGFANRETWTVESHQADSITLILRDNENTLKQYPFHFCVRLQYQLKASSLVCTFSIENLSNDTMPYYAGFHPYFLINDKANTALDFKPNKSYSYNNARDKVIAEIEPLSFPRFLNDPELNERLHCVSNNTAQITFSNHDILSMIVSGLSFPYIQLYTDPEKPFFCVEPWMGYPNGMNTPGIARKLEPNKIDCGEISLVLE